MSPTERVHAALTRAEEQGFSSARVAALAERTGVDETAVLRAAVLANAPITRRAGALWILLLPRRRDLRTARAAREALDASEDRQARAGRRR